MGAEDKYLLDLLGRNHIDLGTFNSGRSAEAAAATYDVVGNKDINVITYGVNKNNLVYRAIIINQYNEARNLQYLFYDGNRYTRYIDKNGGAVSTIQPWQKDGARNINYDSSARELSLTTMHGDVVGAKVVLPLASSSDAGLMSSSDKAALASLAKYIRYTPSNRILALQNEAKSNISTVILPIASTEEPGLLSAADFTKLSNYPTKLVKDLGLMSSTDAGDAEAAKSEIAGDRSISLIRYTTQGVSAVKVTTIFQWCNGINEVAQIKFVDKAQWRRNVTGATGVAGATTTPTMWERTGAHCLGYDSATRKIQLKDHTQTVFRDVQLPLASSSDAGLMSPSDKEKLDQSGENIIEGIDILSITTTQQVDSQYSGVTKLSNAFSNLNKRLVFSYDNVHDGCSYSITPVFRAKTIIGGSGEAAYTFKLAFVSPTDGSTIIQLWEARDGISCWQVTVEIL